MRATRCGLLLAGILGVLACQADDDSEDMEEAGAALATESDSVRCGTRDFILTNLTRTSYRVHVRLTNGCHAPPLESLITGPARLRVLDSMGQVHDQQDVPVRPQDTDRFTVRMPPKGKIEIVCGDQRDTGWCPWSYSYSP